MTNAIEVLRDELKYNFNQMGVHTYDKVINEALLALERTQALETELEAVRKSLRVFSNKQEELKKWLEKEIAVYSKRDTFVEQDYLTEQKLIILKEVLERVGEQK